MGMTRLGSDGSLPNSNWQKLATVVPANTNAATLIVASTKAQRCLIRADSANTSAIAIGPTSAADYASLSAGDEYNLSAQPGTTFDLSAFYQKVAHVGDFLRVIFQA